MQNSNTTESQLFQQFSTEVTALKGAVYCIDRAQLGGQINEILDAAQTKRVAAYRSRLLDPFFERGQIRLPEDSYVIPKEKGGGFNEKEHRRRLAASEIAISSADFMIARTGSLIFLNRNHPSRLVTLLSPGLIIVAELSTLLADLPTLHRQFSDREGVDSPALAYYTGPSRTADIEKTLVLGVHGPKDLHIIALK